MVIFTGFSKEINDAYKMTSIEDIAKRLFEIPIKELLKRVNKWDLSEVYAWAFGFSLGDASIDRAHLQTKRVDVETSRLGTIVSFITVFLRLAIPPIKIRFYIRENSKARFKMRAYAKVSEELLELMASRGFDKFNALKNEHTLWPFLAGLIDSDGSIQPYVKRRGKKQKRLYFEPEICITNSNVRLLNEIQRILLEYSVRGNVTYAYTPGVYRLRINSIDSVYGLLKSVGIYLLNFERISKAKIIQLYYGNKISLKELIVINKKLKEQNKRIHDDTQSFISLMSKNGLMLIINEDGKTHIEAV